MALPHTTATHEAHESGTRGPLHGNTSLEGDEQISLDGWRGMVGHNWGSEHAERWIWLHGVGFEEEPEAWLDVALGRIKLAGRMTPWVANGALSLDGRRLRLGGLGARGLRVKESPDGCVVSLAGEHGLRVELRAEVPRGTAAGWRYADPDGGSGHDVINCSIAALELTVALPGDRAAERSTAPTVAPMSSACASATTASRLRRSRTAEEIGRRRWSPSSNGRD